MASILSRPQCVQSLACGLSFSLPCSVIPNSYLPDLSICIFLSHSLFPLLFALFLSHCIYLLVILCCTQASRLSLTLSLSLSLSIGQSMFRSEYLCRYLSISRSHSLFLVLDGWLNLDRRIDLNRSIKLLLPISIYRSFCHAPWSVIKSPLHHHSPSFHMHTQNVHIKISSLSCTWHDRPITQVIHPQILPPDWPASCWSWCHGNLWWSSVAVHIKDISRKER